MPMRSLEIEIATQRAYDHGDGRSAFRGRVTPFCRTVLCRQQPSAGFRQGMMLPVSGCASSVGTSDSHRTVTSRPGSLLVAA